MTEEILFDGLTRSQMIHKIHMETDTSSWCYKCPDYQLIAGYIEIFNINID